MNRHGALSFLFVAASALAFVACTPDYPKCKTDEHCKNRPPNKTDKLVWCVKGMCVECRDKADCPEGSDCENGACKPIPGYCSPTMPCPPGQVCRNNRCGPECSPEFPCPAGKVCENQRCVDDVECRDPGKPCPTGKKCVNNKCEWANECGAPGQPACPAGQECKDGKCVAKPECGPDKPCPAGQKCEDGKCVAAAVEKKECKPPVVLFDFDKSDIREDQKAAVAEMATCIKDMADKKFVLEGHCDERGTKEYNIALGERRWKAVRDALKAAGVGEDKLEGISLGEEKPVCTEHNEACWQKNRRVEAKAK